jgi:hypothetical protein
MRVVFTGCAYYKFGTYGRKFVERAKLVNVCRAAGIEVQSSVHKAAYYATICLVYNPEESTKEKTQKMAQAQKYGVKLMPYQDFFDMLLKMGFKPQDWTSNLANKVLAQDVDCFDGAQTTSEAVL